jgi:2EXR family
VRSGDKWWRRDILTFALPPGFASELSELGFDGGDCLRNASRSLHPLFPIYICQWRRGVTSARLSNASPSSRDSSHPNSFKARKIPMFLPNRPNRKLISDSADNSTRKFTCFPHLPSEIRHQIWKHASFFPRNVDITASCLPYKLCTDWAEARASPGEFTEDYDKVFYYLSHCPPPEILSVNSEARAEGLIWYSLTFGVTPFWLSLPRTVKPHIYVNPEVDTILVINWGLLFMPTGVIHDFRNKCTNAGLRSVALNLKGRRVGNHTWSQTLPRGVGSVELVLFDTAAVLYQKPRWMEVRIERTMDQMGVFDGMLDSVVTERKLNQTGLFKAMVGTIVAERRVNRIPGPAIASIIKEVAWDLEGRDRELGSVVRENGKDESQESTHSADLVTVTVARLVF